METGSILCRTSLQFYAINRSSSGERKILNGYYCVKAKTPKIGALIMKNLVRGGFVLSLLGMFVAIMYAQTDTALALNMTDDSQLESTSTEVENNSEILEQQESNKKTDKKLVKKTVMSSAAGMSKGSFVATAYCLKGRTAMGHGVRSGLIAADPRVLKLGSRINVSGGAYSGNYLVSDTGGGIKGRRLDIWMASCSEARRFGRRTVTVSVPVN
jgi:3D (Asp-Asp-Asp) domain-containing protein